MEGALAVNDEGTAVAMLLQPLVCRGPGLEIPLAVQLTALLNAAAPFLPQQLLRNASPPPQSFSPPNAITATAPPHSVPLHKEVPSVTLSTLSQRHPNMDATVTAAFPIIQASPRLLSDAFEVGAAEARGKSIREVLCGSNSHSDRTTQTTRTDLHMGEMASCQATDMLRVMSQRHNTCTKCGNCAWTDNISMSGEHTIPGTHATANSIDTVSHAPVRGVPQYTQMRKAYATSTSMFDASAEHCQPLKECELSPSAGTHSLEKNGCLNCPDAKLMAHCTSRLEGFLPSPGLEAQLPLGLGVVLVQYGASWASAVVVDSFNGILLTNAHLFVKRGRMALHQHKSSEVQGQVRSCAAHCPNS